MDGEVPWISFELVIFFFTLHCIALVQETWSMAFTGCIAGSLA